jgi:hypothetical protein
MNTDTHAIKTATAYETGPVVWIDYQRQKGGSIISVKCGSRSVRRRCGEPLEVLEGRAIAYVMRCAVGHLMASGGTRLPHYCPVKV